MVRVVFGVMIRVKERDEKGEGSIVEQSFVFWIVGGADDELELG